MSILNDSKQLIINHSLRFSSQSLYLTCLCFLFYVQEFLLGLNARKAIALSINLCSQQFTHPESPHGPELKEKLKVMNHRWEAVCARAAEWQRELQMAIIECEEFHQTTDEMLDWLNSVERKLNENEPVDLSAPPERLIEQYRLFSVS